FASPGSLTADEIYAVSAYILAEAKIIDKSIVLDAQTLPRVEMPNRHGFVSDPRPEVFKCWLAVMFGCSRRALDGACPAGKRSIPFLPVPARGTRNLSLRQTSANRRAMPSSAVL